MKAKSFCLLLIMTILLVSLPTKTMAATKGRFGNTGYCTVRINNSLLNKRGRQYAYVTLKTQDQIGWGTSAKVNVTLRDESGRYIWSGVQKTSTKLKLGDDHRYYRIYVTCYQESERGNWFLLSLIRARNFENLGKCVYWTISNAKNCVAY